MLTCLSTCMPITNWIATRRAELIALELDTFIVELCARFLPDNWHVTMWLEMSRKVMGDKDNFIIWIEELITMNGCLWGTTSHFSDEQFITIIGANIHQDLYSAAITRGVYNTTIYDSIQKCFIATPYFQRPVVKTIANVMHLPHPTLPIPHPPLICCGECHTSPLNQKAIVSLFLLTHIPGLPKVVLTLPRPNCYPRRDIFSRRMMAVTSVERSK